MKISSEDVKAIQNRVDVTYEEAERFLIKAKGDIDLAVYMINRKKESSVSSFMDKVVQLIKEMMTYHMKVEGKNKIYIDLPLILVVMLFVIVNVDTKILLLVITVGLILISESKVTISKLEKEDEELIIRNEKADDHNDQDKKAEKASDEASLGEQDKDDDYYEITIEK